jgi:hypothetical protein
VAVLVNKGGGCGLNFPSNRVNSINMSRKSKNTTNLFSIIVEGPKPNSQFEVEPAKGKTIIKPDK